ncbi:MAG: LytTR family DNA-binding domain-containing protein [Pseudomonadota bacterium]
MVLNERTTLLAWWLGLAAVLTELAPASSAALTLLPRFAFWGVHVGLALLLLTGVTLLLNRLPGVQALAGPVRVVLAALVASLFFAPVAVLLEGLFPGAEVVEDDPAWLMALESSGLWGSLLVEWLELVPEFVLIWLLVNLTVPAFGGSGRAVAAPPAPPGESPEVEPELPPAAIFALVPERLGTDLISLQAELNYVHVRTTLGEVMVLSSLTRAMNGLGDRGIQVHRSWWVADRHVRRVRRGSKGYLCELHDGTVVPVSRRRQRVVVERFGRDTRYDAPEA